MTLMRWNPYREVQTIQDEINHLLNGIFNREARDIIKSSSYGWIPTANLIEDDKSYKVEMELPGLAKNDIKISTKDNTLTVSGEVKTNEDIKKNNYHLMERQYGKFFRSFVLPTGVHNEKIEASFKDGVLSIYLPKVEEALSREITIK